MVMKIRVMVMKIRVMVGFRLRVVAATGIMARVRVMKL